MTLTRSKLDELLTFAYLDARRNERNKYAQLEFELNLEDNLRALRDELYHRAWTPMPCMCFIVNRRREVFAPQFRDRIVSHLLFNMFYPLFDPLFIYDSYSCRKGKGTLFGIDRNEHFLRSATNNFSRTAHVLCLDIMGYFMHINHNLLVGIVLEEMERHRKRWSHMIDYDLAAYIVRTLVCRAPASDCIKIGHPSDWDVLPDYKKMEHAEPGRGIIIGDVMSQMFSNIYLNSLDQFAKRTLGVTYYGRYVDDMRITHSSKDALAEYAERIDEFLQERLRLKLNTGKTRILRADRRIDFLGAETERFNRYARHDTFAKYIRAHTGTRASFETIQSYSGYMSHFQHRDQDILMYYLLKQIIYEKTNIDLGLAPSPLRKLG
ncbi:MAG: reverse transcriptase domain-containing protein [Bacteroides sp.]